MKTFMILTLTISSVIILSVTLVFRFTGSLTEVADQLFSATETNDTGQVELLLSKGFMINTSPDALIDWLASRGLNRVVETQWSQREISGGAGTLAGTVKTAAGVIFPVEFTLVKEEGNWKVHSIEVSSPGLPGIDLPGHEQQVQLIESSVNRFLISIEAEDMEYFREHLSEGWKSEASTEDLNQVYQSFFRLAGILKEAQEMSPEINQFNGPDANGVIQIIGQYNLQLVIFHVEHAYIFENGRWALHGFHTRTESREG